MSIVKSLYRGVFKRTSTLAFASIVGMFFVERFVDIGGNYVINTVNAGKQWKDLRKDILMRKALEEGGEE